MVCWVQGLKYLSLLFTTTLTSNDVVLSTVPSSPIVVVLLDHNDIEILPPASISAGVSGWFTFSAIYVLIFAYKLTPVLFFDSDTDVSLLISM